MKLNSIRKKIYAGLSSLTLLVGIITLISFWKLSEVQDDADKFYQQQNPTVEASLKMLKGLHQSLAELRGWIILGEDRFKDQRSLTWINQIETPLALIQNLSTNWTVSENHKHLRKIEHLLRELKNYQTRIEEVAHNAENRPAINIFLTELKPLENDLLSSITKLIELEVGKAEEARDFQLFKNLTDFESSLGEFLAALKSFLLTTSVSSKEEFENFWQKNISALTSIEKSRNKLSDDQLPLARKLIATHTRLQGIPQKIIAIRKGDKWNKANFLVKTKAAPTAERIILLLEKMILNQQTSRNNGFDTLNSDLHYVMFFNFLLLVVAVFTSATIAQFLSREITTSLNRVTIFAKRVARGDLADSIAIDGSEEIKVLGNSLEEMRLALLSSHQVLTEEVHLKGALSELNEKMRGVENLTALSDSVIRFLSEHVAAQVGSIYISDANKDEETLTLAGSYAFKRRKSLVTEIKPGEGLVSQAVLERKTIVITNVPEDYITVYSSLGESAPKNLLVLPLFFEDTLMGAIELGSFTSFTDKQIEIIEQMSSGIAIAIHSAITRKQMNTLLEKTQTQAEDLKEQQEELQASNEELEEQAEALKFSEKSLKEQQEELRATNEELQEKTELLERQKTNITQQQQSLVKAKIELQEKANNLSKANHYKSEFLANMSHELRTPLNSLLILSQSLAKNKDGNLTSQQIESAEIIHSGGLELLNLINDILDLSKVEAGKLDIEMKPMYIESLTKNITDQFKAVAKNKSLSFAIDVDSKLPAQICTDRDRLYQIIKNFLSNAFKFTKEGSVTLGIAAFQDSNQDTIKNHPRDRELVIFSVTDTGIGIPADKRDSIFQAFQQADGSITRAFGGTGLGLTISRKLAELLGGEISLQSKEGEGSTFSICIPVAPESEPDTNQLNETLEKNDILNLEAEKVTGDKNENLTRPKGNTNLLVIEDDMGTQRAIAEILSELEINIHYVDSGTKAIECLESQEFAGIILDLTLSDMSGFDFLNTASDNESLSIPATIIYTGQELTVEENRKLLAHAHDIVVKGASSPERLLDEVQLILEQPIQNVHGSSKENESLQKNPEFLRDKHILLVDDDIKNVYALSHVLCEQGLKVTIANNGQNALEKLSSDTAFDIVLMDIMMPEMDGYEAIKQIRAQNQFATLPVVVLTAKAMSEDRDKCITAGANDYLTKPVDIEKLISTIQVWLH